MNQPDLIELSRGYVVKVVPDAQHGGFRARLINPVGGVNMEPHAGDKLSAIYQLIKELQMGFSIGDISLASDLDEALEKYLRKAVQGDTPLAGSQAHHRAEAKKLTIGGGFESKFKAFQKKVAAAPRLSDKASLALSVVLLGDDMYVREYKMPKWNVKPTMLREPSVALRHLPIGISLSKSANAQRAEHFERMRTQVDAEWKKLLDAACKLYGEHGTLVSGVYRDHFPDAVKDRLRFLAHGSTMLGDAVKLHKFLSKTRAPIFT
jgi:hypothetical protein